jgi:FMN phosphatase YigB (HAD superfamily)/fucose permease
VPDLKGQAAASSARWPRIAVTAVFVVHGLLFASWTAHIPDVKAHLGLTDGTLGFALLGAPVGSVTAMIACSWLLPRVGSRRIVRVALVGYCAAGPLVGLTGSLPALFGALFVWGAFQGTLDVAMNTQAIAVQRTRRRPLMSGLHGSWSIGAFAGAGIGALAVAAGITLSIQLLVLGTIGLLAAGLLTARMLPAAAEQPGMPNAATGRPDTGPRPGRPASRWSGGMVLLGAIAFAAMLCEGATADWSAVYLSGPLHTRGVVPGLGYTAFSLAMVTVRLSGNRLLTRFRPDRLLPALASVATLGFAAALLIAQPPAALLGFGCLGIGLASVVPAVFSAAGRIPGLPPGTAVATASACGWAGFVCGPPVIGRLSAWASLPVALGLLPLLTAFVVAGTLSSRALRAPRPEARAAVPGGEVIPRLLVDYGEVISAPPAESTFTDLAAFAGQPRAAFLDRYWHYRPAYDLGQPPAEYWSRVLDRDLSGSPQVVDRLTSIDVRGWLRLNPLTLRTLLGQARRTGAQLALLSNAPEPLARAIDHSRWSRHFDHRYYSCRLGAAKPDPQAFELVLADLGAQPEQVLFIDDRAENTRTARDLGMHTITFTSASALDRSFLAGTGFDLIPVVTPAAEDR